MSKSNIRVKSIKVINAGVANANGIYKIQSPEVIPVGFSKVCKKMFWNDVIMWEQLSDLKSPWFLKDDDAYIYYNKSDKKYWLDAPEGHGLYTAFIGSNNDDGNALPPVDGFEALSDQYGSTPILEYITE